MSGGGGTTQTQMVAGTVRTANFTANNSEAGYTFTVQAENKAGKGAVSAASAPRRATGKLGQVSGVSATAADTGGAGQGRGHQLPGTGRRRTQRLPPGEVSYTYYASPSGKTGAIRPGPDGGRVHQRAGHHHHRDGQLERGAELRRQRRGHRHTVRVTRNPVGVRPERRREPEEPQLQLELAVDGDQRRRLHPDQHRRRRLGTGRRPREAGPSTPAASANRTPSGSRPSTPSAPADRSPRPPPSPDRQKTRLDHPAQHRRWTAAAPHLPGPTSYDPDAPYLRRRKGGDYDRPWMSHYDSVDDHRAGSPTAPRTAGRPVVLHHARLAEPDAVDQFHPHLDWPARAERVPNCTFPVGATP